MKNLSFLCILLGVLLLGCDYDGDGIIDTFDNCIDVQNPDQNDRDGDRLGDACDPIINCENNDICDEGQSCDLQRHECVNIVASRHELDINQTFSREEDIIASEGPVQIARFSVENDADYRFEQFKIANQGNISHIEINGIDCDFNVSYNLGLDYPDFTIDNLDNQTIENNCEFEVLVQARENVDNGETIEINIHEIVWRDLVSGQSYNEQTIIYNQSNVHPFESFQIYKMIEDIQHVHPGEDRLVGKLRISVHENHEYDPIEVCLTNVEYEEFMAPSMSVGGLEIRHSMHPDRNLGYESCLLLRAGQHEFDIFQDIREAPMDSMIGIFLTFDAYYPGEQTPLFSTHNTYYKVIMGF